MRTLLLLLCLMTTVSSTARANWERVVDLRGSWLFRIGDDPAWADPDLDDRAWDEMFVPSPWEDEGFWGYDGYAWYRKHVTLPKEARNRPLYLHLGRVDDVDAAYVNGHFVGGTGRFPPQYQTAFADFRIYRIPPEYLNPSGHNVIALRVFDSELKGGLLEGKPGLYTRPPNEEPPLLLDLAGAWKLHLGEQRPSPFADAWATVTVPGTWEMQGFPDYNGYAWYRKAFFAPAALRKERLVLVLGKIDDLDAVYLNGRRIGATGSINRREVRGQEWQVSRVYPIPPDALHYGATNELVVEVYDGLYDGGIYEGPIGIAPQTAYQQWSEDGGRSFWENIWRTIWNDGR